MQPKSDNIAARAGRWSAAHRKTAIMGWFVTVIVLFMAGNGVGLNKIDDKDLGTGESGRATKVVDKAFPVQENSSGEQIHIQNSSQRVDSPEFKATVADAYASIAKVKGVTNVDSPYTPSGDAQLSPSGHSATVTFDLPDTETRPATDLIDPTLAATRSIQEAHPGYRVEQFGEASAMQAVDESLASDFSRALKLSLPITLLILVVAFGTLVAAGIPLLLAITGVMGTMGVTALMSTVVPMEQSINEVILLIGLAVGVDYSLFYLRREREERAAGRSETAALEAAAATSGHAVLVSGLTVIVAMAGMFLAGSPIFTSFAIGAILVVAVAMIGSLTVLPALLSKLGDRVEKGRVPLVGRLKQGSGESRLWNAVLNRVLRRPKLSLAVSVGLLVALAIPAFGMHTADSGVDGISKELPIMKTYKRLTNAFPGAQQPAIVVVQAQDVTAPEVAAGIDDLKRQARATKGVDDSAIPVEISKDRTVASVAVPLVGSGNDKASTDALATVRSDVVPSTIGEVDGVKTSVTGSTAESVDFNTLMKGRAPLVFVFVLTLAFVLMLVTFRSIVIPIKAIALNLLSVGAAYGVLTLVFQDGWFDKQLGFTATGAVAPWLPLFLFVVLFGLSMDYHVFILSRIRELYDRGMSTNDAVAQGIKTTAGVVTSAAIVMVAVFAIFASLSFLDLKMLGVGLGTAVLIDATIIRGVVLPAAMTLLGDANWYLPRWLEWLPGGAEKEAKPAVYDREVTPAGRLGTELN